MSPKPKEVDNTPLWRIPVWFPDLSPDVLQKLKAFHEELIAFNGRMNLISNRTERHADLIHFADCIIAAREILKTTDQQEVYDIGSGNGLPGLVIAILEPNRKLILIERDARKCEFMRHVMHRMSLTNVEIRNLSVEDLPQSSISCAVSRGFAPLGKAIVITRKAFAPKGQYFHFKGDGWVKEVSDIPVQVFGHWKPRLLTEYKLPEDIANLSVVVTERLA